MTDGEFSSWNFMAEGRIQEELISLPKFSILQVNNYVSQRSLTCLFSLNPFIEVISELLALQSNLMLISPEVTEMSLVDGFLWIEDFELSDECPGQV